MKKYSKGFEFTKDLIESDFLLLSKESFNLNKKQREKAAPAYVDVLETSRSLKYIVRMIQMLKKEELFSLLIWVEDKFLYDLTKKILITQSYDSSCIQLTTCDITNEKEKLLFVLGKVESSSKALYKKLVSNRAFLLNYINSNLKQNKTLFYGNYISYANLYDIKKLIFFLVLINNTLINLNEKNQ